MNSDKNNITKHTKETIQASFILNLKGIFTIADFLKHPLKPLSFRVAFIGWLIFTACSLIFQVPLYDLITDMVNQLIIWIPCILGFTIGGYSFLIGFIQSNLMQKISEPRPNSNFSLFQVASAAFACNIILQGISFIIAFVVHYAMYLDSKRSWKWVLPDYANYVINLITFLLVGLSFAISLAVVIQIVINVFNFSQLHHYNTNKEKLELNQKNEQNGQ